MPCVLVKSLLFNMASYPDSYKSMFFVQSFYWIRSTPICQPGTLIGKKPKKLKTSTVKSFQLRRTKGMLIYSPVLISKSIALHIIYPSDLRAKFQYPLKDQSRRDVPYGIVLESPKPQATISLLFYPLIISGILL